MAEDTFLSDDLLRQLMSVGEVDVLVAIPTYNNAGTIAKTAEIIEESFQQSFVRERVAILNVDGGSSDDTSNILLQMGDRKAVSRRGLTSLRTVHRVTAQYAKSPSQGLAVRTILEAADLLRAKACAVLSPSTSGLTPSWVANLLRPAYREGFEFVAPLYSRSKYQGLLARQLLYPMSRAAFARRIREVYSEEWGFSGRLASRCLEQEVWSEEAVRARPEAWMAFTTICSGGKCCQSFLGARATRAPGAGPDIVEIIRQIVGNLFWSMEAKEAQWMVQEGSEPTPTFGPDHELTADELPANPEKMLELFRNGVHELEPILGSILSEETHGEIKKLETLEAEKFHFENELWVKTLYEFAAGYHHTVMNRDHLVQALVPLYRGRIYSFLLENADASADDMEAESEALCAEFERQKPYLTGQWKTKAETKAEVKP